MSVSDDGGMRLGGSISIVEQLQLQLEALSIDNAALLGNIDALHREKEEWTKEKASMSVHIEQNALRLREARRLKKKAEDALSDAQDELQQTRQDKFGLRKELQVVTKALEQAKEDRGAASKALHNHMHQCPEDGYAEQIRERTRALRKALAYELADEAYVMNESNGTAEFVIPVRITIWVEHSDVVAGNNKWRHVRRNAKNIMLSWYRSVIDDTGVRDYLEPEIQRWFDHDEEDVVLQRRRGV